VLAGVFEPPSPVLGGGLRFVAVRRDAVAVELPEADQIAVVDGVAVRADEDRVAVRRDHHRLLEHGEVADDPRREHERKRREPYRGERGAGAPSGAGPECERHQQERYEQERVAAGESGKRNEHPEPGGEAERRSLGEAKR